MVVEITGPLIFDLIIQVVVAVLYGFVAWTISRREVSERARLPNQAFSVWWWGLAVLTGAGVLRSVGLWFRNPSLPTYMAYLHFVLLLIMIAFAGMLYYFLYLWSGRSNLWVPISTFYFGLYIFFVYYIHLQEPTGLDAEGSLQYANDLSDSIWGSVVSVAWLLPPILGAGLYLGLLRRVHEPLLRFRIGLVATSIIVWFMFSIGGTLSGASTDADWWTYLSRAVAATAAGLTLVAYRPPAKLRQWLHLDPPKPKPDASMGPGE